MRSLTLPKSTDQVKSDNELLSPTSARYLGKQIQPGFAVIGSKCRFAGLGLGRGLTLGSSGRAALPAMEGQGQPARR